MRFWGTGRRGGSGSVSAFFLGSRVCGRRVFDKIVGARIGMKKSASRVENIFIDGGDCNIFRMAVRRGGIIQRREAEGAEKDARESAPDDGRRTAVCYSGRGSSCRKSGGQYLEDVVDESL